MIEKNFFNESEIRAIVAETVATSIKFFIERGWVDKGWSPDVKLNFTPRGRRSWGGVKWDRRSGSVIPFVKLSLGHLVNVPNGWHVEYRSFANDTDIGTVKGDSIKAIRALVVHEMCHAVQYSGKVRAEGSAMRGRSDQNGHGALWKNLYRECRRNLVNDFGTFVYKVPSVTPEVTVKNKETKVKAAPRKNQKNVLSRDEAYARIRDWFACGMTRKQIIDRFVQVYGYKKGTATTYSYEAMKNI